MQQTATTFLGMEPSRWPLRAAAAAGLLALCACAGAPTAPPRPPASPADGDAVLRLEQDWCEAFLKGDAEGVARIEDDGYVYTNIHAEPGGKADDLAQIRNRSVEYSRYENREQNVRLDADTITVTGVTALEGVSGDIPLKMEVRFTDTFAWRGGAWKATARQVARIQPEGGG
jgi:ketosteroid isomerase-like protein